MITAPGHPRRLRRDPHPEWWGKTFFKHFPNHGFVGDIFTVNGTAYPVLEVKRRKYRFRFLDASIARIYEFKLMRSAKGPKAAVDLGYTGDELQGQYRIPDGQQCMQFTQIASDGGLLPRPVVRDSFELWPAKRREVDRRLHQVPGRHAHHEGRRHLPRQHREDAGRPHVVEQRRASHADPTYKVPMLKIVIGDDAPDDSVMPTPRRCCARLPTLPSNQSVAGQPHLRGPARQRRRRDRVAHQRPAVRRRTSRSPP